MLFSDWREHYPRDFEIHPSCVCGEGDPFRGNGNSSDSGTIVNKNRDISFPSYDSGQSVMETEIVLTPNPTDGELHVSTNQLSIRGLIVFDVAGRSVMQVSAVNSPQATLNVTSLDKGMYLLSIRTEDGQQHVKKFVKR